MIAVRGEDNSNSSVYPRFKLIPVVKHRISINDAFAITHASTQNICDFKQAFGLVCGGGRADPAFSKRIYAGVPDAR